MLMKTETTQTSAPLVWVLQTARAGDSAQARALADALGWPYELKTLRFNSLFHVPNKLLGATLMSVAPEAREALSPPWPDLVIGVARRTVPAARWIRAQAGGHTKLVQLGRPRLDPSHFDLVISTPQYGLPARSNVLSLPVPIHAPIAPDETDLNRWSEHLSHLPRPWTAVVLGGAPWPFRFDGAVLQDLAARLNALSEGKGSCIICSSPRTPAGASDALAKLLKAPSFAHTWSANAPNPYKAVLQLADQLVVSGDSASMLAEACSTGKPVYIFDLPNRTLSRTTASIGRVLSRTGLIHPPRDMRAVHTQLTGQGQAQLLGAQAKGSLTQLPNQLQIARSHVVNLFEGS